jgi:uncharacterized membrane protein YdbT with pleckstrin-like domain
MIDIRHLPNCKADERLVYFLRRHPITLLGVGLGYAMFFLIPFLVWWILQTSYPGLLQSPTALPLIVAGGSMVLLFMWLFLFQLFLDYYLDIWVVTNHRIVNITQSGLFHRQVAELRLYRVQDATASIGGFLHTLLNFGTIEIQTAGEQSRFVFHDIPDPQEVTKTILHLVEEDRAQNMEAAFDDFEEQGWKRARRP